MPGLCFCIDHETFFIFVTLHWHYSTPLSPYPWGRKRYVLSKRLE